MCELTSVQDCLSERGYCRRKEAHWSSKEKCANVTTWKGDNALSIENVRFQKCKKCNAAIEIMELQNNMFKCPHCGEYFTMPVSERLKLLTDDGSFEPLFENVKFENVIGFPDYDEVYDKNVAAHGGNGAVATGKAMMNGIPILIAIMDSSFMMASMGRIVGEKITKLMEKGAKENIPLVMVTASGGARMQEGIVSLMQMVKTTGGVRMMNDAKVPYIVVITNPTSGGVSASFAMLGDLIFAEPKALICFAGPRIVKETVKTDLPEGFQTAENVLEHGFIDAIVKREDLKDVLTKTLTFFNYGKKGAENGK